MHNSKNGVKAIKNALEKGRSPLHKIHYCKEEFISFSVNSKMAKILW